MDGWADSESVVFATTKVEGREAWLCGASGCSYEHASSLAAAVHLASILSPADDEPITLTLPVTYA